MENFSINKVRKESLKNGKMLEKLEAICNFNYKLILTEYIQEHFS